MADQNYQLMFGVILLSSLQSQVAFDQPLWYYLLIWVVIDSGYYIDQQMYLFMRSKDENNGAVIGAGQGKARRVLVLSLNVTAI
jgi:hypothetical protein